MEYNSDLIASLFVGPCGDGYILLAVSACPWLWLDVPESIRKSKRFALIDLKLKDNRFVHQEADEPPLDFDKVILFNELKDLHGRTIGEKEVG